ncbi:MAG: hypothetical protein ACJ754_19675 [Pyrinomonadaceae bacterium]
MAENRVERDREKVQEERESYERASERQQKNLRQRELDREEERERDLKEFRARERRRAEEAARDERTASPRARYGPRDTAPGPGPSIVMQDLGRLAYAWTRTSAEAINGITQTMGDLVLNLTDSIWGRRPDETTSSARARYSGRARYDERDYFSGRSTYDNRRDARTRSDEYADRSWNAGPAVVSDISVDVSKAVRQTADVLSRSAENFSRVFERETERDDFVNETERDDFVDEHDEPPPAASASTVADDSKEPKKPITDRPNR